MTSRIMVKPWTFRLHLKAYGVTAYAEKMNEIFKNKDKMIQNFFILFLKITLPVQFKVQSDESCK